jgi:secreted PhoX family phosphatase
MRDDDIVSNKSSNRKLQEVVDARVTRRGFLGGGLATAAALSLGGISALLKTVPASAQTRGRRPLLGFQGIPVSDADTVVVPPGYTAEVLIA